MHILEYVKSADSKISASEVVQGEMSNLLARMHDFKQFLTSKEQQETIDSWRHELSLIRHAVDTMLRERE